MDLQITPEPTEAERAAIVQALELETTESPDPSAWWKAGIGPPAEETYATTPPRRQSRGATRA